LQCGIFLAVVVAIILLRRRHAAWLAGAGPQGTLLLRAIGRPVSLAILLTGMLVLLWPAGLGDVVISLGSLAMLLPLVRLVPLVLPPETARAVWAVVIWFFADELLSLLPQDSLQARICSILLAAAAGAFLLWLRGRLLARPVERRRGILLAGIHAALALLAVVVAGQIVGTLAFSRFLLTGLRDAVFASYLLYGLFLLLEAPLLLLLRRRDPAESDTPALVRWLHFLLLFLVALLFLTLLLKSFELDSSTIRAFRDLLAYQISVGALEFTVASVFTFLLVCLSALAASHLLRLFLAPRLFDRMALGRGTGAAVSKLIHYAMLSAGFLLALAAAGIDLDRFSVVAGGLGVGVAFGLQNILSNFVSGLILLFERPVHVGDQVTVGVTSGEVTDIGIRASTIRTWDGADVVIPNASLITSDFTNWTLSDDRRRSEVVVGAAYGCNPERVIEILKEVARAHPKVQKHPEPFALFIGFGDSSLNFVLRYWTFLECHVEVNSDLHREVYRRFTEAGIEIPFPQRDIHVRTPAPPAP
jgi:small-conductance mechanosensitive channel